MITPTAYEELKYTNPFRGNRYLVGFTTKVKAQNLYCKTNNIPYFMPVGQRCYCCNKDAWINYTLQDCQTKLLTECSECAHSYCE
jgi:hypothetical protein